MEVFDTKTQTCDPKPIPCSETFGGFDYKTLCLDGKFHVGPVPVDKTRIRLADYGGKRAVLWPNNIHSLRKMIWCAEVTLEKRKSGEIWGKVEWFV